LVTHPSLSGTDARTCQYAPFGEFALVARSSSGKDCPLAAALATAAAIEAGTEQGTVQTVRITCASSPVASFPGHSVVLLASFPKLAVSKTLRASGKLTLKE
jgi:hypothetical protein